MNAARGARPSRRAVVTSAVCAVLVFGSLLALPLAPLEGPDAAVLIPTPGEPRWWALLSVFAAQLVLVAWAWLRPARVFVGIGLLSAAAVWLTLEPGVSLWSVTMAVAAFGLAVARPLRQSRAVMVTVTLVVAANSIGAQASSGILSVESALNAVAQPVMVLGIAVGAALAVRARRELAQAREHEREARLRAAVSDERAAMARELHDIAAHHLSGMALTTAAIQRLVDTDPEQAKAAAGEVREQTTVLLRNLRRLVGLLREDAPSDTASAPTVPQIGALVETWNASGAEVTLTVRRPDDGAMLGHDVGPLAQLAAYRMVQESLANAVRHAPGAPCAVTVDDRVADVLSILVENAPAAGHKAPAGRTGFGLVGMRERAELTGSTLSYGPRADGGWRVSLVVPRDPDSRLESMEVSA